MDIYIESKEKVERGATIQTSPKHPICILFTGILGQINLVPGVLNFFKPLVSGTDLIFERKRIPMEKVKMELRVIENRINGTNRIKGTNGIYNGTKSNRK